MAQAENRRKELDYIFRNIDEGEKQLLSPLLDEVVFLEGRMAELKELPFVAVNPRNPALQKTTSAAKQYKECSQSYMNAIRILCNSLRKIDSNSADDLRRLLGEFE
jgi:hypothetical protein